MADSDLAGLTALVTGGAGFVGHHLAARLVGTAEVRVLDDLSTGRRAAVPEGATFIERSVRDADGLSAAVEGVDVVFHQAAVVGVERSPESPRRSHAVNVDGTLAVLDAARRVGARVVLASSAAVYGQVGSTPVAESDPKEPVSPYGVDKLAADCYARRYHDRYGLETVALRYFNVYGPSAAGDDPAHGVVGTFLDRARDGRPLVVHGGGEQTRDFVHVSDVVAANLAAATADAADVAGGAYNVGTGVETSIVDLAGTVRDLTGRESEVRHAAPREGDIRHSAADVSLARERLGYEPSVSLAEGVADLVERSA